MPQKHQPAKPPNAKRVRDLAAKLALEGFSGGMFEQFSALELAKYCLDVATSIYEVDADDDNE